MSYKYFIMKKIKTLNSGVTTTSNLQGTVNGSIKDVTNKDYLYWLGGFVEGEGCVSISVIANPKTPFGIQLQPVFNVTQHFNGLDILKSFLVLFGAGSLHVKSGADHV